jgi:phosphoenolpyruvate synthase/pyruvate phosphate dikinase
VFGEPIDVVFAEDHLAVDDDIEDASCAFDQSGVDLAVILDCGGQTGRLGFVVSLHAVGDRDFHR